MPAMDTPTVSVVIPAYNAEPYLQETLDSALAQTLPVFEILVVDDGSTDATAAIIDANSKRDPRVRRIQQPNSGISATRNHGAARAKGEWLAFLDADDRWVPEKLEHQLGAWDGCSTLLYTDRRNFGDTCDLPERASDHVAMHSGQVFERLLTEGNFITTSTVVQSRRSFEALGGFTCDERVPVCEDWDLWLRHAATGESVQCVRLPLTEYRIHALSTSRSPSRMTVARLAVVRRAFETPAGRALSAVARRKILAGTYRTNAWDFNRHGDRSQALAAAALAVATWPLERANLKELARVVTRR